MNQRAKDIVKKFESIVLELFEYTDQINTNGNNNQDNNLKSVYLYDQPIFNKFKKLIVEEINIINEIYKYQIINLALFLVEFNSNLVRVRRRKEKR